MKLDINMSTIWTMLAGTAVAIVYMFNTFAKASDLDNLSYLVIKSQIRDVRVLLREEDIDDVSKKFLTEDLLDLIDRLCRIEPADRECERGDTE